jgi:hypothetical protein
LVPCESYITYQPNRTSINSSKYGLENLNVKNFVLFSVKISNLDDNTHYKIKIYAEQISTHLLSKSIDLSFTTKRSSKKTIFFLKKMEKFFV